MKTMIHDFSSLIDTVKTSIVIGTASRLAEKVTYREVFSDYLMCYRKDRNRHGGSVSRFVAQRIFSSRIEVDEGS